jgi:DNA-binding transcriptional regulator YhcF (GntR family)
VPIYQQLVDTVRAAVKKGTLTPGQQLPTVQELATELAIARGTIKRAYDELEHLGLLEKVQGRGTFICYQPQTSGSRKERAMAAIDELLDALEDMGFSSTEINIFLTLKQRERSEDLSTLKLAVVECNAENLSRLADQLRTLKGVELYCYLLDSIQAYPYKLEEDLDLVITTAEHAEFLEGVLPDPGKLARVALRLSTETLSGIVKLRPGEKTAIVSYSPRFGDLVYSSCRRYARNAQVGKPLLFSEEPALSAYATVLVPREYEKYCSEALCAQLKQLEKKGKLILCSYKLDEGSFLHLEEKLRDLRSKKKMG